MDQALDVMDDSEGSYIAEAQRTLNIISQRIQKALSRSQRIQKVLSRTDPGDIDDRRSPHSTDSSGFCTPLDIHQSSASKYSLDASALGSCAPASRISLSQISTGGTGQNANYLLPPEESTEKIERRYVEQGAAGPVLSYRCCLTSSTGISLLVQARYEYDSLKCTISGGYPSLARHLLIYGLTYTLRGLPKDLSETEAADIWRALPAEVRSAKWAAAAGSQGSQEEARPSILHRITASLTLTLIVVLQALAPRMRRLACELCSLDRQHRVSQRALQAALRGFRGVVWLGREAYRRQDGMLGEAVGRAVVWVVEGIGGGVREGIGMGLGEGAVEGREP
jgi:hypothetical protein